MTDEMAPVGDVVQAASETGEPAGTDRMAKAKEIQTRYGADTQADHEASVYANNGPLRRAVLDVTVKNDGIDKATALGRVWAHIREVQARHPGYLEEFRALYGLDAAEGWVDREEEKDRAEYAGSAGSPS